MARKGGWGGGGGVGVVGGGRLERGMAGSVRSNRK